MCHIEEFVIGRCGVLKTHTHVLKEKITLFRDNFSTYLFIEACLPPTFFFFLVEYW